MQLTKNGNILRLLASIVICNSAGILGSFFTAPAVRTWYTTLEKPFFTPPNWLFAPVWITLYTLMGLALYFIWIKNNETKKTAKKKKLYIRASLWIFAVHLFANAIWSIIFFGLQRPDCALVNIVVLWGLILWVMIRFYKIDKKAALILIPYILWVTLATALNFEIWRLN